jgi:hypothetical protein
MFPGGSTLNLAVPGDGDLDLTREEDLDLVSGEPKDGVGVALLVGCINAVTGLPAGHCLERLLEFVFNIQHNTNNLCCGSRRILRFAKYSYRMWERFAPQASVIPQQFGCSFLLSEQ